MFQYAEQRKINRQVSKRLKLLSDEADIDRILLQEEAIQELGISSFRSVQIPESDENLVVIEEAASSLTFEDGNITDHLCSSTNGIICKCFLSLKESLPEKENVCVNESTDEPEDELVISECDQVEDGYEGSLTSSDADSLEEVNDLGYDWRGLEEEDTDEVDEQFNIPGVSVDFNDESFQPGPADLSELYILLEECRLDEVKPEYKLRRELALWTSSHNIVHEAVNDLLRILRDNDHPTLPCSTKTLLNTPRSTLNIIKPLGGGTFWYHGILKPMSPYLTKEFLQGKTVIVFDDFMDGVSPYRSVRRSRWPIVGCLVGDDNIFIIAMWCGNSKEPTDLNQYLEDFVCEAKQLMIGFTFNNKNYKLQIRKYIALPLCNLAV